MTPAQIDELEATVHKYGDDCCNGDDVLYLIATARDLRTALAKSAADMARLQAETVEMARARGEEIARLRDALTEIAAYECMEDHDESETLCPYGVARAALAPKPDQGGGA